ncbi:hypothetical protein SAMN05877838_2377 [Hoeflea halophila]|uniref:Uncharacterized protein n=1 Tax=Hoeflea halophila TaxID=714899 RepID=A0A286IBS9_9HYPH|nr:hypothetical protein [Hoeflea halophila]SOE17477.1 hypothetical protein SAMN05877838_2377 [Hoeflea halophila]
MAIKVISIDDFERMSVDTVSGRLYWDGKEIVTTMALPWWVQVAAVIAAVSTAIMAVVQVVQLFSS